ncbi:hypothetical protein EDB85DRAFT_2143657 [Lactarius pseudohatsudake]|nr:hypothetical protein EDB85DRAFT_2143657 [Lactarius pseudohatsudake]
MVAGLAVLVRLRTLSIEFFLGSSPPDEGRRCPDPPVRTILPALSLFHFKGYYEYLEDLLAQIDTPQVDDVRIEYFLEEIRVPQLSLFIGRTKNLKLAQFRRAQVFFYSEAVQVDLDRAQGECPQAELSLSFLGSWLDDQVPCMAQLLGQLNQGRRFEMDSAEWLPLLRLFPAVEALHLSGGVAACIASALEDTAKEMTTEVFPALHLLWLDEDNMEDFDKPVGSTEKFFSSRQLSDRPVTLVRTQDEFVEELKTHRGR